MILQLLQNTLLPDQNFSFLTSTSTTVHRKHNRNDNRLQYSARHGYGSNLFRSFYKNSILKCPRCHQIESKPFNKRSNWREPSLHLQIPRPYTYVRFHQSQQKCNTYSRHHVSWVSLWRCRNVRGYITFRHQVRSPKKKSARFLPTDEKTAPRCYPIHPKITRRPATAVWHAALFDQLLVRDDDRRQPRQGECGRDHVSNDTTEAESICVSRSISSM